jgi:hypothetical protein
MLCLAEVYFLIGDQRRKLAARWSEADYRPVAKLNPKNCAVARD